MFAGGFAASHEALDGLIRRLKLSGRRGLSFAWLELFWLELIWLCFWLGCCRNGRFAPSSAGFRRNRLWRCGKDWLELGGFRLGDYFKLKRLWNNDFSAARARSNNCLADLERHRVGRLEQNDRLGVDIGFFGSGLARLRGCLERRCGFDLLGLDWCSFCNHGLAPSSGAFDGQHFGQGDFEQCSVDYF